MLYVEPEAFQRELNVVYDEPNGRVSSTVEVRVLEQSNDQVGVVGDTTGTLRPQLIGANEFEAPEPIVMTPADIPERPEPLGGLSSIVWAGDSGSLSEGQRRSIDRWIAEGGRLVVIGGADWQARTSAFTDILPDRRAHRRRRRDADGPRRVVGRRRGSARVGDHLDGVARPGRASPRHRRRRIGARGRCGPSAPAG